MASQFWKDKKVLFIGDSATARGRYPEVIAEMLGIQPFYHCKDGAHVVGMVDGERGLNGDYTDVPDPMRPLSVADVQDKDLIVLFGGYNNLLYGGYKSRSCDPGKPGDCYRPDGTGEDTVAGVMQYAINRIYEELEKADNKTCRLLIVTVDCTGKNQWVNADGYHEFPPHSGRSYKKFANIQKAVAAINGLPCCDLFHTSGLNPHTWCVFCADAEAVNSQYTQYLLDENGNVLSDEYLQYQHMESYYQIRDGKVVLEQYTGYVPYPYNNDQIHKSAAGVRRMAEVIAGAMVAAYGV